MTPETPLIDRLALRAALALRVSGDARRAFYEEVAWFCDRTRHDAHPAIVGISGPQGSGKSSLAGAVTGALSDLGVRAVAMSVDDFYLTRGDQVDLARRHPGDRCLEHRGYPGTHDVPLATDVLAALREGRSVAIPRYDKSAHGGRGDRAPMSTWHRVDDPVDLVVFEGWMLGFTPVLASRTPNELATTNALLASCLPWSDALDAFVLLEAADLRFVVDWRCDAERARRARGEPALSSEETRDYIERFLPAYRLWVPGLRVATPGRRALRFLLGPDRLPIEGHAT